MSRSSKEKRADIWMPLYIADYLADTSHLSTEEHGAYLLLLMNAWSNEGELPLDDERLRRITRMDVKAWKASSEELKSFFYEHEGHLRHQRIDNELTKAKANVKQRSEAGKASAEKRRLEREAKRQAQQTGNENSTTVATDDATEVLRNSRPSPSPKHTTEPDGSFVCSTRTTAPADMQPSRDHMGIAMNQHLDVHAELAKFLDHHRAEGSTYADWNAAFSKWLRTARQFGSGKDQQRQPQSQQASRSDDLAALGVGSQYREVPYLEAANAIRR